MNMLIAMELLEETLYAEMLSYNKPFTEDFRFRDEWFFGVYCSHHGFIRCPVDSDCRNNISYYTECGDDIIKIARSTKALTKNINTSHYKGKKLRLV